MSLYTKYRPHDFNTIVGQEQVKDILNAEVYKGKLNSSYIFFGPRGTGKTSTARILTKAINCTGEGEKPCNKCESCNLINSGKTLDFVEIDAASNTQVDKIREEIIDKAMYPPTMLKKKIYVIDEVHMLSKSAFNALLKIMEEPADYLTFILATTEVNKVPETIISRCEVFNFQRISQENIIERLKYIAEQENIEYELGGLELIAKISDGGLRDAIKYLEQVSIIGTIDAENVTKFLGIAPERQIIYFIDTIKSKNINDIFSKIEQFQKEGVDLGNFVKDILLYLDENLTKDLENNLELVNLFDKVYSNIKNFPTPALAYKTIIGGELIGSKEQVTSSKEREETKTKEEISNQVENNKKDEGLKTKEETTKKEEKDDIKQDLQEIEIEEIENNENKITKEVLVEKVESPVVRGIIKSAGNIEYTKDGTLEIIIISQANYTLLKQDDKQKALAKTIDSIVPGINFEIKYMSKEDYLDSKLKN